LVSVGEMRNALACEMSATLNGIEAPVGL